MKQFLIIAFVIVAGACKKATKLQPSGTVGQPLIFSKVLILGNSITYTPANPSVGWPGSWGMAATVADSDYVHLLTAKFQKANPACIVTTNNISPFEFDWVNYNIDANLHTYRDLNPDLVILRIGENVNQMPLDTASFGAAYKALVKYFGTKTIVLGVGSLWSRPVTDAVMAKYARFFTLGPIGNDYSVYSFGLWANPGIAQHPGNKGMRIIADSIWNRVNALR
jgi:hypothetical protein